MLMTAVSNRSRLRTYALIPGAGGAATWYWRRVVPLLEAAGHEALSVDLPGESGLPEYAGTVANSVAGRPDVVLVAQSLGGFTAPLAAGQVPLRALVFVNAMIPVPGETAGEWWDNTGQPQARAEAAERGGYPVDFDLDTYFFHDVPADLVTPAENQHDEGDSVFDVPCQFAGWPDVPIKVVAGADDRFFPASFQQAVARERLGLDADMLPGGHLIALSQPESLAAYLLEV
jgi:Alpha/beta hydrolase family